MLAACSTGQATSPVDGPLGAPGDPGTVCTPGDRDGAAVDGFEALRNRSTKAVTIRRVRLLEPDGLRLKASYLLPIRGHVLVGIRAGTASADMLSRPAEHAQLVGGATANLVLELQLEDPAASGKAAGVEVAYESSGKEFRWLSGLEIGIVPLGAAC